jgi:uncharacterized integral membrane protein
MSFLRTLFWIVVAVVVALFCFNNWTRVSLNLWNGLVLDTKLPVLLLVAFLLGLLPTLILWQATRWRLRRRIQSSEVISTPPSYAEPSLPAAPISAVPPGGA